MERKTIFSGIQPSGILHIGNYLGAIKNWISLQDEYDCLYCMVDMHAITVPQEVSELKKRTLDGISLYIAAGLDPQNATLFVQSHVPAHAELQWILNCFTYMGELNRMTQFKEKSAKQGGNITAGLFDYPVLMAADILLYGADLVPVGADQKQHIEITRDVAIRFNNLHGDVFTIPEPYIPKAGARIMSLQEPTSKMSKSDPNPNGYIAILDEPDVIRRKVRRAVTDSEGVIRLGEDKPGVTNLLCIYAAMKGCTPEQAEKAFAGQNYGALKDAVADALIESLAPLQNRYKEIRSDKTYLDAVLKDGADKANYKAERMIRKVQKKVGFVPRVR